MWSEGTTFIPGKPDVRIEDTSCHSSEVRHVKWRDYMFFELSQRCKLKRLHVIPFKPWPDNYVLSTGQSMRFEDLNLPLPCPRRIPHSVWNEPVIRICKKKIRRLTHYRRSATFQLKLYLGSADKSARLERHISNNILSSAFPDVFLTIILGRICRPYWSLSTLSEKIYFCHVESTSGVDWAQWMNDWMNEWMVFDYQDGSHLLLFLILTCLEISCRLTWIWRYWKKWLFLL